MADRPVKTVRAEDFLGSYIAYTYADGHTETDPPNRPASREDAQRTRLIAVSRDRSLAIVASQRERFGVDAASLPPSISRENAAIVNGSLLRRPYTSQVNKLSNLAETSSAPQDMCDALKTSADLGGPVVGDNASTAVEYQSVGQLAEPEQRPSLPLSRNS